MLLKWKEIYSFYDQQLVPNNLYLWLGEEGEAVACLHK